MRISSVCSENYERSYKKIRSHRIPYVTKRKLAGYLSILSGVLFFIVAYGQSSNHTTIFFYLVFNLVIDIFQCLPCLQLWTSTFHGELLCSSSPGHLKSLVILLRGSMLWNNIKKMFSVRWWHLCSDKMNKTGIGANAFFKKTLIGGSMLLRGLYVAE